MCVLRGVIITVVSVLFAAGMIISPCSAKIDPESVAAMWLLDNLNDNIAEDQSGNGHNGTVAGAPKLVAGKFGEAAELRGASITVPDSESLNFGTDSFTVVLWLSFATPQDWNRLVRERNPSPWGSGNYGWEVQTEGVQIHFSLDDAAGNHQRTSYPDIGDDEWHHGAMIVDREKKVLRTYMDGANERTIPIGNIDSVTDTLPVVIGGGFMGVLDEIAIFKGVLELDDIQTIMNSGLVEAIGGVAVSPAGKTAATWGEVKAGH